MNMKDGHHHHHIYEQCKEHMHNYVLADMIDGTQVDGIITGVDEEYVYMAVPIGEGQQQMPDQHMHRQFGYGYGGYGGYPGYGYGPRPRFRRLILPLAALTALSVLPWY